MVNIDSILWSSGTDFFRGGSRVLGYPKTNLSFTILSFCLTYDAFVQSCHFYDSL